MHYRQLPRSKCDGQRRVGTTTMESRSSYSSSSSAPMTLSQVLNEKYRHHRHLGGDVAKNGMTAASLPPGIRGAVLKSSYYASPMTAMPDENADARSCIDMIYHTRFLVDGAMAPVTCIGDETGSNVVDDNKGDDDDGDDGRRDANDDDDDENVHIENGRSRVHCALWDIFLLTSCVSGAVDAITADGTLAAITDKWLATDAGAPVLKP